MNRLYSESTDSSVNSCTDPVVDGLQVPELGEGGWGVSLPCKTCKYRYIDYMFISIIVNHMHVQAVFYMFSS